MVQDMGPVISSVIRLSIVTVRIPQPVGQTLSFFSHVTPRNSMLKEFVLLIRSFRYCLMSLGNRFKGCICVL